MVIPDNAGFKLAWRVWIYHDKLLTSFNGDKWIPKRKNVAECCRLKMASAVGHSAKRLHPLWEPAPNSNCSCGIYAVKRMIPYTKPVYGESIGIPAGYGLSIAGKVALWGKVIEHEKGYRAEFAYPYELYVPVNRDILFSGLGEYDVPIIYYKREYR